MLKRVLTSLSLVAGLALATSANANLIVNGSFEENAVAAGGWEVFNANQVNGWDGSRIEIWNGLNGVVAQDGTQHAELNAHGANSFTIFQNFATVVGQTYDVSFFYRARQNRVESFSFTAGNLSTLINHSNTSGWTQFTGSFEASSVLSSLTFSTVSTGTLGNFIDNVVVTSRATVNESSAFILFGLGLLGLVAARKKAQA